MTSPLWQRAAAWLLGSYMPVARRDELLGDLAEDVARRRRSHGLVATSLWLAREIGSLHRAYRLRHIAGTRAFAGVHGAEAEPETFRQTASAGKEKLVHDLKMGIRMLRKAPGVTVVALLTLALSVGANTLMFSVVEGALLRPLPYRDADRLMSVVSDSVDHTLLGLNVSFTKLEYTQAHSRAFETVGAFYATSTSMTTHSGPEQILAARVTGNFFDVLSVTPATGRVFSAQEDREGGADVAIITDNFWRSHFDADPSLVGREVRLDGKSVTIIGVLPPAFQFAFLQPAADVWFPRVFENPAFGPERVHSGAAFLISLVGRVRSGQTLASLQTDLTEVNDSYRKAFPGWADAQLNLVASPLKESLVGTVRASLVVLFAAVGFVLLIACSNIASMLLARATTRSTELAVRRAMGASQGRLVRQLLTESLLLSFLGGAVGVFLANRAVRLLPALPVGLLPRASDVRLDGNVLAFSILLCTLAGLCCGLVPALRSSRPDIVETLKLGGRGAREGRQHRRARGVLVVAEVALAVVVVTSAGLLVKSFASLMRVEPGFDPAHVMTFSMTLPSTRYALPAQQAEFYRRLVEDARQIPTVQAAAVTSFLPLGNTRFVYFCPEGAVCLGIGKDPLISLHQITPEYFRAMGIPLLAGRGLDDHDRADSTVVGLINELTAKKYFPNQDPVGKYLVQSRGNIKTAIVGVVGDVRSRGPNNPVLPELFVPQSQRPTAPMSLVLRSTGPTVPLVAEVRRIVSGLDRDLPFSNVSSMDDQAGAAVAQPRLTAQLTGSFALLALLLATIGIYGVLAYTVSQRTYEIGMRLALGSPRRDVVALVLGQGLRLVSVGIVLGTALSLGATRLMSSLLVGTSARDPITFAGVAVLLVAVAMLAAYIPARRASRVDPIIALRQ